MSILHFPTGKSQRKKDSPKSSRPLLDAWEREKKSRKRPSGQPITKSGKKWLT